MSRVLLRGRVVHGGDATALVGEDGTTVFTGADGQARVRHDTDQPRARRARRTVVGGRTVHAEEAP